MNDNELRRIETCDTSDEPTVTECGCSGGLECFPHHSTDDRVIPTDDTEPSIDTELLPDDVGELTRIPKLGERAELPGVGTVEVATVDGEQVYVETFEGTEYVLSVSMVN